MYGFAIPRFLQDKSQDGRRAFIERVRAIQREFGSRQADEFFINAIQCESLPGYNESYYSAVVDYNSALYLAHCGEQEEAARLMDATGLLPATGGALLFSDHNRIALAEHERRQAAETSGAVSILIAALPKSASASLSHSLSELLGASVLRLSIGTFPDYALVPNWVKSFCPGGAVSHDHFGASAHNLRVLTETGIKHVFVQVRDPRAAVWSFMKMRERQRVDIAGERPIYGVAIDLVSQYSAWISSWLVAARQVKEFQIDWIRYDDFNADPFGVIERVLVAHNHTCLMREAIKKVRDRAYKIQSLNLATRADDAWRQNTSPDLSADFWRVILPDVREFLGLES